MKERRIERILGVVDQPSDGKTHYSIQRPLIHTSIANGKLMFVLKIKFSNINLKVVNP